MIVKMKKYTFLVYHREYDGFLKQLREQGVVHVAEKQGGAVEDESLRANMQLASRFKSALNTLDRHIDKANPLPQDTSADGLQLLDKIDAALHSKEQLFAKRQQIEKEMDRMAPWGVFSWERIHQLEKWGLEIRFYSCASSKFYPEWESLYHAMEIDTFNSLTYFVTVTHGEPFEIEADLLKPGPKTISELQAEAKATDTEIASIDTQMKAYASGYEALKQAMVRVIEEADFRKVQLNTTKEAENKVMILEGYSPGEKADELNKFLDEQGIFYVSEDPAQTDEAVPVKLKNNKYTNAFEFIGGLYELPNYHKTDMTPYFAPFYMLFFGFCFADVVYGLLLAVAAWYFGRNARAELKPLTRLLFYLGVTAFFMGFVTGNVGGIQLEKIETNWPWYEHLKQYILTSEKLFYASLILGAIQIIYGQFVRAISRWRTEGFKKTISTWGWLILVIGLGITFALQSEKFITPATGKITLYIILAIAGICIFLLNNIGHNIFLNIGEGVWDTYEKATGWLSDLLSYIRLFAICISGAVLAIVFNSLATSMSGDTPVVSQIVMILILAFGHFINIFMAILASFVHPLRLTFVEFYKNAGFIGGGKPYRPFAHYHEEFKIL
jgi:V/A-type H+-transporting ATPase subunit I